MLTDNFLWSQTPVAKFLAKASDFGFWRADFHYHNHVFRVPAKVLNIGLKVGKLKVERLDIITYKLLTCQSANLLTCQPANLQPKFNLQPFPGASPFAQQIAMLMSSVPGSW